LEEVAAAADRFKPRSARIAGLREYGNGNVHGTFLVTLEAEHEKHFILQRMNTQVFCRPELVMLNMRTCTEHMREKLEHEGPGAGRRRWETPKVIFTRDGRDHWIDSDGAFWRAISFIEDSQSFDTIQDIGHALEVGAALGIFHSLISDLPAAKLADTLKGFHVTPLYLRHYDEVSAKRGASKTVEVDYALRFISERREWAAILEEAGEQGRLKLRSIHGDPKVNNVMIDTATGQAVAMVDLDTVKPGLIHYDIGDCLRSCCNPLGEETSRWEAVRFEPDLCRAVLEGYLSIARAFLTENDYAYVYDAIRLIAFELGLRFFTDYLEGNVYFKVKNSEHNLARALVQFKLTESIELQKAAIDAVIRDMR
jgi:hypothetical protein